MDGPLPLGRVENERIAIDPTSFFDIEEANFVVKRAKLICMEICLMNELHRMINEMVFMSISFRM